MELGTGREKMELMIAVHEEEYHTGEYVYVRQEKTPKEKKTDKDFWIARILGFRAESEKCVYALVCPSPTSSPTSKLRY